MRSAALFSLILLILLPVLAGCRIPLSCPTAEELLSYESTAFVCGFTASENGAPGIPCALTRTDAGDVLSVTMPHSTVAFSFTGGESFLTAGAAAGGSALSVPAALPADTGAARWRSLFCISPDASMTVSRGETGFVLSSADGTLCIRFSPDGHPECIRCGSAELTVTAFLSNEQQES